MGDDTPEGKATTTPNWGLGIALGVAIGIGLGSALGNPVLGIGIGLAIGVAFAYSFAAERPRGGSAEDDSDAGPDDPPDADDSGPAHAGAGERS